MGQKRSSCSGFSSAFSAAASGVSAATKYAPRPLPISRKLKREGSAAMRLYAASFVERLPPVCFFVSFATQSRWPRVAFAGRAVGVHAVRISSATIWAVRSIGGGWFVLTVAAAFALCGEQSAHGIHGLFRSFRNLGRERCGVVFESVDP